VTRSYPTGWRTSHCSGIFFAGDSNVSITSLKGLKVERRPSWLDVFWRYRSHNFLLGHFWRHTHTHTHTDRQRQRFMRQHVVSEHMYWIRPAWLGSCIRPPEAVCMNPAEDSLLSHSQNTTFSSRLQCWPHPFLLETCDGKSSCLQGTYVHTRTHTPTHTHTHTHRYWSSGSTMQLNLRGALQSYKHASHGRRRSQKDHSVNPSVAGLRAG